MDSVNSTLFTLLSFERRGRKERLIWKWVRKELGGLPWLLFCQLTVRRMSMEARLKAVNNEKRLRNEKH